MYQTEQNRQNTAKGRIGRQIEQRTRGLSSGAPIVAIGVDDLTHRFNVEFDPSTRQFGLTGLPCAVAIPALTGVLDKLWADHTLPDGWSADEAGYGRLGDGELPDEWEGSTPGDLAAAGGKQVRWVSGLLERVVRRVVGERLGRCFYGLWEFTSRDWVGFREPRRWDATLLEGGEIRVRGVPALYAAVALRGALEELAREGVCPTEFSPSRAVIVVEDAVPGETQVCDLFDLLEPGAPTSTEFDNALAWERMAVRALREVFTFLPER